MTLRCGPMIDPLAKLLASCGATLGGASLLGASLATLAGAFMLAVGRPINWANWIGIGGGVGTLWGVGVLIAAALTTGLN
jgi:hypothetical protein